MTATDLPMFDLSPAEKLQLVEDLWDELGATPEAIPIHSWQKDELARVRANLLENPASGIVTPVVPQSPSTRCLSSRKS